jgi:glyoxylase-like metal-dependent hydrolase (beta-lactamase superfamily II)
MSDHRADFVSSSTRTIGEVRVTALLDAEGSFATFRQAFPGAGEEVERRARERYTELFRGNRWFLPFRCFLVEPPTGERILVDAGIGPPPGAFLPERQGLLLDKLKELACGPSDIDTVFLTHLHVDHVGWCADAGRPVFSRARYHCEGSDYAFFASARRAVFEEKIRTLQQHGVLDCFDGFFEAATGVRSVTTPGHTPGHTSLRISSGDMDALILGDVAVHPVQVLDPSVVYTADEVPHEAIETRASLFRELAASGEIVFAGHFPGSGIGRITETETGYSWEACPLC